MRAQETSAIKNTPKDRAEHVRQAGQDPRPADTRVRACVEDEIVHIRGADGRTHPLTSLQPSVLSGYQMWGHTWPGPTLLGNSKKRGKAILHTTFEG
jgi:hypothetical protein